jgi:hypothetical protein
MAVNLDHFKIYEVQPISATGHKPTLKIWRSFALAVPSTKLEWAPA